MAPKQTAGRPEKTAKARVTAHAATHGWMVRDDGGPGMMTDYLKPGDFIRVRYDRFGRVTNAWDRYGTRVIHGAQRERQLFDLLK